MTRTFRPRDARPDPRRDVTSELRFHLDMRTQEFVEQGMSPDEARRAAAASFGDVEAVEAQCVDVRERRERARRWHAWRWNLAMDCRYALRTLGRSRLFTAAAVLTLALGIGGAAAVFTFVNGVLLRPLPYADPQRLVMVWSTGGSLGGSAQLPLSAANYVDVRDRVRSLAPLAAFRAWPFTLAGDGTTSPLLLAGARAAPTFFATLGVRPMLGRAFTEADAASGSARVVVIGHELWQRRFAGDPRVLGRPVTLSGDVYQIVGVMPPDFAFPRGAELPAAYGFRPRTELWTPLSFTAEELAQRGTQNLAAVARVRPGVTMSAVRADLARVNAQLAAEHPRFFVGRNAGMTALTLQEQASAPVRRGLLLLLGAVGLVLLIACANVASLLVARATDRGREFAVRIALGATRGRLFLQLVVENVALTLTGAVLGLGAAWVAAPVLARAIASDLPRADDVTVDVSVVAVTLIVALVAGVLFAVATAMRGGRGVSVAGAAAARATSGRQRRAGRRALVVAEVALSLVLLAGAGLLSRSFVRLLGVDPGFSSNGVMTAGLLLPIGARFDQAHDGPRWNAFFTEYTGRLAALPGVVAAGGVSALPLSGAVETTGFVIEGQPVPAGSTNPSAEYQVVAGDYFRAVSVPLLAGRTFDTRDAPAAPPAIVVSAAFARRYFPRESPNAMLGRRLRIGLGGADAHTIVGVVGDVRQTALDAATEPALYLPLAQFPYPFLAFVVRRADGRAAAALPPMRRALAAMSASLALDDARPLGDVVRASVARQRLAMAVTGAFALTALALAAVGLYGVIATSVAQRTRELGVRLALGATPADVLRLVVGEGMRVTIVGLVVGLAGALAAARLLRGQLYDVGVADPLVFVGGLLFTGGIALLATWLPARRATRVDPTTAIRGE